MNREAANASDPLGPCIICGDMDYELSCGGPSICPKCDCGHFDAATVQKQAKVIANLRAQLAAAEAERDDLRLLTAGLNKDWNKAISHVRFAFDNSRRKNEPSAPSSLKDVPMESPPDPTRIVMEWLISEIEALKKRLDALEAEKPPETDELIGP